MNYKLYLFLFTIIISCNADEVQQQSRIQAYAQNPFYWQYKGKPVMLIGASKDDNLFQVPDLKEHLVQMAGTGANYVRNTMSERTVNGYEASAFKKSGNKYDLNLWNEEYWQRFSNLLKWCNERDIIIQIEIWATHDFFTTEKWEMNPWNPDQNINYNYENTKLSRKVPEIAKEFHPFFNTVPKVLNDSVILAYQSQFVDKILSYSLSYPNVLYCVTNEVQHAQSQYWSWYWAEYIKEKANEKNLSIYVTEMFWAPDLKDDQHKHSYLHPELCDFFEASQNSAKSGQENWDNLQFIRNKLMEVPKPINSVKIYGKTGEVTWPGTDEEAVDRFWRNILGGCASSRFHRNEKGKYGLGWCEESVNSIRAMNVFLEDIHPWEAEPKTELLLGRSKNEAYLMAVQDKNYGLYLPGKASVQIDLSGQNSRYEMKWINVKKGSIDSVTSIEGDQRIEISNPDTSQKWAITLVRK